jgi:glycerol uptake facilitator-like aquaporin
VTLAMRLRGALDTRTTLAYIAVQVTRAILGVVIAHAMFDQALLQPGTHVRAGAGQWLSEGVATFGLLLTILLGGDAPARRSAGAGRRLYLRGVLVHREHVVRESGGDDRARADAILRGHSDPTTCRGSSLRS